MKGYRAFLWFVLATACFGLADWFGSPGWASADPLALEITQRKNNKSGALTLTFDDGYESQYSVGVAVLNEYGLKGTFFVITDAVDLPEFATWDNWRSAADSGHEIGNHSRTPG